MGRTDCTGEPSDSCSRVEPPKKLTVYCEQLLDTVLGVFCETPLVCILGLASRHLVETLLPAGAFQIAICLPVIN
jgi:hypothetical protein